MDRAHDRSVSVDFEAGVLSPVAEAPLPRPGYSLGWFVQSVDVNAASVRYRCFHFARVLAPEFHSRYFTTLADVEEALTDLNAIVVVKRLDRPVMELVAKARVAGVSVFLDLCDDLIAPAYAKNDAGVNLLQFLGIAPFLAGVTVPSAEMADRLERHAADNGLSGVPIHVIPDIAETWDIYRSTSEAVTGSTLPPLPKAKPSGQKRPRPRQVLWFGNYGASHSNFGIFSLKTALKALKSVNAEIPLELVVVSNSEPVFRALSHNCGFPTRYVPWSPTAVYSELCAADVALLTTGDDEFCAIKSSNRVAQALASRVPVISPKSASLVEFEDSVFSGRVEEALRLCLGPARDRVVPPRMAAAQRVLQRYTPERLGAIWAGLLTRAIDREPSSRAIANDRKLLFVLEPGDTVASAKTLLASAKAIPGLDYDLLVSTDLLEEQPEFNSLPRLSRTIPRFFSGKLKGARNLLLDRAAVIVERPGAPVAKQLARHARSMGVELLTNRMAAAGGLERFAATEEVVPPSGSSIKAGPYDERTNADGTVDWAFIVHQNARGWILDAICREIGSRQPAPWQVCYYPDASPLAKNYFFSHYLLLENYLERRTEALSGANVFVWYTHPRDQVPTTIARQLLAFEKVTKVIFACESNRHMWLERGLAEEKAAVVLGAADPKLFRFHERGGGVVGLSSSFYERKNPDVLLDVMKLLPQRQFLLLGRKWNQYALFEEMKALPNFTYLSPRYGEYPELYATFDVFLSMSTLEGGPIPLVEAMMSNAVPVASRTGFAPDLIRHGENGFIFDIDASAKQIAGLIEKAFALEANVRATVEQYDWDNFSAEIVKLAQ
jgi:glycosyltransferase involved in cell wall biosynthesis